MNISLEQLKQTHLPAIQQWAGRKAGALTWNDFPTETGQIPEWYERNKTDVERLDCLVLAYDTPVGIAGLLRNKTQVESAELYLFLGEVGYNHIRTATYATLSMLDRAFQDIGFQTVSATVYSQQEEYLESLERMGFHKQEENGEAVIVKVERGTYFGRKYLF